MKFVFIYRNLIDSIYLIRIKLFVFCLNMLNYFGYIQFYYTSFFLFSRIAEDGDDQSDEEGEGAPADPPANPNDEFNFEKYDEEDQSKIFI